MKDLASFNRMVRKWADKQPKMYRKTALAFGYRCDTNTHSFDGTLAWISKKSRERKGEGVSRPTLERHLKVFEKHGVITVERRRNGSQNMSSFYHVNFDKLIGSDDGYDEYLASLARLEPVTGTPSTDADGLCNCFGCDRGTGCIWADD
jgi:DNA-binding transcriptional ArsR family regulator